MSAIAGYDKLTDAFHACQNDYKPFVQLKKLGRSYQAKHPLDFETREILNLANFELAYIHSVAKENANIVVVLGPTGRGKTNLPGTYCPKFCNWLKVPWSWQRSMYIGEDVIFHRKKLASKHHRHEHIVVDEAELVLVPGTKKYRMFKHTLASGRDAGLHYWILFPTTGDVNFSLFDSHGKWAIHCLYRSARLQKIFFKVFFNGFYLNQFDGGEWIEYPYPGSIY